MANPEPTPEPEPEDEAASPDNGDTRFGEPGASIDEAAPEDTQNFA